MRYGEKFLQLKPQAMCWGFNFVYPADIMLSVATFVTIFFLVCCRIYVIFSERYIRISFKEEVTLQYIVI